MKKILPYLLIALVFYGLGFWAHGAEPDPNPIGWLVNAAYNRPSRLPPNPYMTEADIGPEALKRPCPAGMTRGGEENSGENWHPCITQMIVDMCDTYGCPPATYGTGGNVSLTKAGISYGAPTTTDALPSPYSVCDPTKGCQTFYGVHCEYKIDYQFHSDADSCNSPPIYLNHPTTTSVDEQVKNLPPEGGRIYCAHPEWSSDHESIISCDK